MLLHCTKKLIEQLGFEPDDLDVLPPANPLLSWHAHVVSIARGKTLVVVNDQTFYTVIIPQMLKRRFVCFEEEFRSALSASLNSEGFQDHHLNALMGGSVVFTKSRDRQVLGIINNLVEHIRFYVETRGGWEHVRLGDLTQQMNRIPWLAGTRRCVFAIEKMTADLVSESPSPSPKSQ